MAALEAMARGRAVIATRVGEMEDAVVDGRSGILVEPGDVKALAEAMQVIVGGPELATEMGRFGQGVIARDFTQHVVVGLLGEYTG